MFKSKWSVLIFFFPVLFLLLGWAAGVIYLFEIGHRTVAHAMFIWLKADFATLLSYLCVHKGRMSPYIFGPVSLLGNVSRRLLKKLDQSV